jgi:hypothetical protein
MKWKLATVIEKGKIVIQTTTHRIELCMWPCEIEYIKFNIEWTPSILTSIQAYTSMPYTSRTIKHIT